MLDKWGSEIVLRDRGAPHEFLWRDILRPRPRLLRRGQIPISTKLGRILFGLDLSDERNLSSLSFIVQGCNRRLNNQARQWAGQMRMTITRPNLNETPLNNQVRERPLSLYLADWNSRKEVPSSDTDRRGLTEILFIRVEPAHFAANIPSEQALEEREMTVFFRSIDSATTGWDDRDRDQNFDTHWEFPWSLSTKKKIAMDKANCKHQIVRGFRGAASTIMWSLLVLATTGILVGILIKFRLESEKDRRIDMAIISTSVKRSDSEDKGLQEKSPDLTLMPGRQREAYRRMCTFSLDVLLLTGVGQSDLNFKPPFGVVTIPEADDEQNTYRDRVLQLPLHSADAPIPRHKAKPAGIVIAEFHLCCTPLELAVQVDDARDPSERAPDVVDERTNFDVKVDSNERQACCIQNSADRDGHIEEIGKPRRQVHPRPLDRTRFGSHYPCQQRPTICVKRLEEVRPSTEEEENEVEDIDKTLRALFEDRDFVSESDRIGWFSLRWSWRVRGMKRKLEWSLEMVKGAIFLAKRERIRARPPRASQTRRLSLMIDNSDNFHRPNLLADDPELNRDLLPLPFFSNM
ncbi:hypothetical protein FB451DRAFT_1171212 [Mycena latifolia]|nr:hypothetical protein FB451DRAFT_1171212 [Mycena latifolia]